MMSSVSSVWCQFQLRQPITTLLQQQCGLRFVCRNLVGNDFISWAAVSAGLSLVVLLAIE